jgi:hypothetical protein
MVLSLHRGNCCRHRQRSRRTCGHRYSFPVGPRDDAYPRRHCVPPTKNRHHGSHTAHWGHFVARSKVPQYLHVLHLEYILSSLQLRRGQSYRLCVYYLYYFVDGEYGSTNDEMLHEIQNWVIVAFPKLAYDMNERIHIKSFSNNVINPEIMHNFVMVGVSRDVLIN